MPPHSSKLTEFMLYCASGHESKRNLILAEGRTLNISTWEKSQRKSIKNKTKRSTIKKLTNGEVFLAEMADKRWKLLCKELT